MVALNCGMPCLASCELLPDILSQSGHSIAKQAQVFSPQSTVPRKILVSTSAAEWLGG
jgi:hypothetical protein